MINADLYPPRSYLAPGAASLIKTLTNPDLPVSEQVDIKKSIKTLEVRDWALLLKAFDEWPFAPEVISSLIPPPFGSDFVALSLTCWNIGTPGFSVVHQG